MEGEGVVYECDCVCELSVLPSTDLSVRALWHQYQTECTKISPRQLTRWLNTPLLYMSHDFYYLHSIWPENLADWQLDKWTANLPKFRQIKFCSSMGLFIAKPRCSQVCDAFVHPQLCHAVSDFGAACEKLLVRYRKNVIRKSQSDHPWQLCNHQVFVRGHSKQLSWLNSLWELPLIF